MKTITKLFSVALLALFMFSSLAVDFSTNAAAGLAGLVSGKIKINSIYVNNATTNAVLVHIYDSPVGSGATLSTTYTNASYTVIGNSSPSSVVTTYTNVFGTVENWTNTVVTNLTTTVSAATNNYPKLVQINIAASSAATWTPSAATYTSFGLMASNGAAVTFQVNYNR